MIAVHEQISALHIDAELFYAEERPFQLHLHSIEMLDYALGQADDTDRIKVEMHLQGCLECALEFEDLLQMAEIEVNSRIQRILQEIPCFHHAKNDPTELARIAFDDDLPEYHRAKAAGYLASQFSTVAVSAICDLAHDECESVREAIRLAAYK